MYRTVICGSNHRYDPRFDDITCNDRKYLSNRVESDHTALERLLGYRQSLRSLRSAKTILHGMEAIRTIKNGHNQDKPPGACAEVTFAHRS